MNRTHFRLLLSALTVVIGIEGRLARAQGVVPGTGTEIEYVGDTFEDPEWTFVQNGPKSSHEQDGRSRMPLGYSANKRWFEGPERGYPDHLKVVPTPKNGLPGSEYALQICTLNSGVPGRITNNLQQDDLIADCVSRLGSSISASEGPNCVVRVYLPPDYQWENRTGPHFGFRLGMTNTSGEPYWPGIWIHYRRPADRKEGQAPVFMKVRGDSRGRDFHVLDVHKFGWWTLGMSVTPDGGVHYYAHPGVEPLTAQDHLTSQYPYSFRCQQFRTFFFNICNHYDGRTWSTPFLIDDPQLFLVKASRVESIVERKLQAQERNATAKRNDTGSAKGR